jgi:hypothetical protein
MAALHDPSSSLSSAPALSNEQPQSYDDLMVATFRFERYRVLIRKLAHHKSGTGQAMTSEERYELRQLTAYCLSS